MVHKVKMVARSSHRCGMDLLRDGIVIGLVGVGLDFSCTVVEE